MRRVSGTAGAHAAAPTQQQQDARPKFVPREEIVRVEASDDIEGGGTGKEFKENIVEDGEEPWNKW